MSKLHTRRATLAGAGTLALASLGVVAVGSAGAQEKKEERHPHIRAAIRELREAKRDLKEADHDFGGHRKDAIKAVDHAIEQLERALQFDRR